MKINEKNLCTFATTPPVDLEGWLNKKGEVNKSWQKRWFVLKGNLLFYFERKTDREPLGVIVLEGCTIELAEECEQYCFQIVFHGVNNRTYSLSAESQDAMELWMKLLTCAGYEYIKIMVTELQRQLSEFEGTTNSKVNSPHEQIVAPKPPPRRQNPFNRPAPAPPQCNPNSMTISPIVSLNNSKSATNNCDLTTPSNSINHTKSASSTTLLQKDDNLFQTVHDLIGQKILKKCNDRLAHKKMDEGAKEIINAPLIIL